MNLFMIFKYDGQDKPRSFKYIIAEKAFATFVTGNQPDEARFAMEEVEFPDYLMNGTTRKALVHYLSGEKFAAYVPVFATEDEVKEYNERFGR